MPSSCAAISATRNGRCADVVDEAVEGLGGLDLVVSNAASGVIRPALEVTAKHWDWTLDINARAFLLLAQRATPHLEARGGGVAGRHLIARQRAHAAELRARRHVEGRARGARPLPRRRARAARDPRQRRLGRRRRDRRARPLPEPRGDAARTPASTRRRAAPAARGPRATRSSSSRARTPAMIVGQILVVDGGYGLPAMGEIFGDRARRGSPRGRTGKSPAMQPAKSPAASARDGRAAPAQPRAVRPLASRPRRDHAARGSIGARRPDHRLGRGPRLLPVPRDPGDPAGRASASSASSRAQRRHEPDAAPAGTVPDEVITLVRTVADAHHAERRGQRHRRRRRLRARAVDALRRDERPHARRQLRVRASRDARVSAGGSPALIMIAPASALPGAARHRVPRARAGRLGHGRRQRRSPERHRLDLVDARSGRS